MTHYEIVKKLIGPVRGVGETNEDGRRESNLRKTIELVDRLVFDIGEAARDKNSPQYSVAMIGKTASKFLSDLEESLADE